MSSPYLPDGVTDEDYDRTPNAEDGEYICYPTVHLCKECDALPLSGYDCCLLHETKAQMVELENGEITESDYREFLAEVYGTQVMRMAA